jgi:hypothetical protein
VLPHAEQVKVAHPLMLRAIAAAKKKNDRIDAGKIADCLRCDFLRECHMAPTEIRDRRRTLRYRHLLVRQMVQMKNRISGLLMETGVSHNKQRLHKVAYFRELLSSNEEVQESIRPLLRLSRETIVRCQKTEYALVSSCSGIRCWPRGSNVGEPFPESDPSLRSPGWWRSEMYRAAGRSSKQSAIAGSVEKKRVPQTRPCEHHFPNNATNISSVYWWKPRNWRPDRTMNWL